MLIYQALYFAQLIVFQGGGRFQSLTDVRGFPAQSARLFLFVALDCPLYRYGKQFAELR